VEQARASPDLTASQPTSEIGVAQTTIQRRSPQREVTPVAIFGPFGRFIATTAFGHTLSYPAASAGSLDAHPSAVANALRCRVLNPLRAYLHCPSG
jgi:hypothetical protein